MLNYNSYLFVIFSPYLNKDYLKPQWFSFPAGAARDASRNELKRRYTQAAKDRSRQTIRDKARKLLMMEVKDLLDPLKEAPGVSWEGEEEIIAVIELLAVIVLAAARGSM